MRVGIAAAPREAIEVNCGDVVPGALTPTGLAILDKGEVLFWRGEFFFGDCYVLETTLKGMRDLGLNPFRVKAWGCTLFRK